MTVTDVEQDRLATPLIALAEKAVAAFMQYLVKQQTIGPGRMGSPDDMVGAHISFDPETEIAALTETKVYWHDGRIHVECYWPNSHRCCDCTKQPTPLSCCNAGHSPAVQDV